MEWKTHYIDPVDTSYLNPHEEEDEKREKQKKEIMVDRI